MEPPPYRRAARVVLDRGPHSKAGQIVRLPTELAEAVLVFRVCAIMLSPKLDCQKGKQHNQSESSFCHGQGGVGWSARRSSWQWLVS